MAASVQQQKKFYAQTDKFRLQVRESSEAWLKKTNKKIAIYRADLKEPGLDDRDKGFLKASIQLLEDEAKMYKELIHQTYRKL
jgi:predicted metal-dependent hydrolase